jgi:hypothetical protein
VYTKEGDQTQQVVRPWERARKRTAGGRPAQPPRADAYTARERRRIRHAQARSSKESALKAKKESIDSKIRSKRLKLLKAVFDQLVCKTGKFALDLLLSEQVRLATSIVTKRGRLPMEWRQSGFGRTSLKKGRKVYSFLVSTGLLERSQTQTGVRVFSALLLREGEGMAVNEPLRCGTIRKASYIGSRKAHYFDGAETRSAKIDTVLKDGAFTLIGWNCASNRHKRAFANISQTTARQAGIKAWMLDSGANGWLVPAEENGKPNDCIVRKLNRSTKINTAAGTTEADVVVIKTPVGFRYACAVPAVVPHLFPMWDVACDGDFVWHKGKNPTCRHEGQRLPMQLNFGIPTIYTKNGLVVSPTSIGLQNVEPHAKYDKFNRNATKVLPVDLPEGKVVNDEAKCDLTMNSPDDEESDVREPGHAQADAYAEGKSDKIFKQLQQELRDAVHSTSTLISTLDTNGISNQTNHGASNSHPKTDSDGDDTRKFNGNTDTQIQEGDARIDVYLIGDDSDEDIDSQKEEDYQQAYFGTERHVQFNSIVEEFYEDVFNHGKLEGQGLKTNPWDKLNELTHEGKFNAFAADIKSIGKGVLSGSRRCRLSEGKTEDRRREVIRRALNEEPAAVTTLLCDEVRTNESNRKPKPRRSRQKERHGVIQEPARSDIKPQQWRNKPPRGAHVTHMDMDNSSPTKRMERHVQSIHTLKSTAQFNVIQGKIHGPYDIKTNRGMIQGEERVLRVNGGELLGREFTGTLYNVKTIQIDPYVEDACAQNGGEVQDFTSHGDRQDEGKSLTKDQCGNEYALACAGQETCAACVERWRIGEAGVSLNVEAPKRWDDDVNEMSLTLQLYNAMSINPHLLDHQPYDPDCSACRRAKAKVVGQARVKDTEQKEKEKAKVPGERQIVDLCGPFPNSPDQHTYMFVGVDEASDIFFVEPLKGKTPAGVVSAIAKFKTLMEEFREWLKLPKSSFWKLKSDLGSEFIAEETKRIMAETLGFQENVVKGRHISKIENTIREISNGLRALISAAGLPAKMWPFAALTYVHNHNVKNNERWAEFLKSKNMLSEEVLFGRLGFSKLADDLQATTKSAEKGAPICYLGPCSNMRKGANIIYITADGPHVGKYHYTTCLHKGIVFAQGAEFAFKRRYKDLQTLSTPGEEFEKLGAEDIGIEPELDKDQHGPLGDANMPHAENKKSAGKNAWWTRPNSTCIACRGRARQHTYSGTGKDIRCRWVGLDQAKVQRLRKEGVGVGSDEDKERLIEEAATKITDESLTWNQVLSWFIKEAKLRRANKSAKACQNFLDSIRNESESPPLTTKELKEEIDKIWESSGIYEGNSFNYAEQFNGQNGQHTSLTKRYQTEIGMFTAVKIGKQVRRTKRWDDVIDEMNKSMLSDRDRARISRDTYFDAYDEEISQHIRWSRCAYVTRNMTKQERLSDRGRNALAEELRKVIDKDTFGKPVNVRDAAQKYPRGTMSGACMLASVKFAEKAAAEQKLKGRLVVLGNHIYLLGNGKETFPKGRDFGLYGDVASLAAFRAVAFHSTKEGSVLESADVSNAYLNASWPTTQDPHYLKVDKQIYHVLPKEWQKWVDEAGGPGQALLPMRKCLYGHPLSGFLWIQQLHNWLLDFGYKEVEGTKALYTKGDVMLCAYVDDLAVAGPKEQVHELWTALQKRKDEQTGKVTGEYDLREVGECKEFLGIQVSRRKVTHGHEVALSMEDYCNSVVKNFEELFNDSLTGNKEEDTSWTDSGDKGIKSALLSDISNDNEGKTTCQECNWKAYMDEVANDNGIERVSRLQSKECVQCINAIHANSIETKDMFNRTDAAVGGRNSKDQFNAHAAAVAQDRTDSSCATKPRGASPKVKRVGVRPKQVPMTPEQDDLIKDQHTWPTITPEKRVMKLVGQLLWVARCVRTDISYPVSRLASGISRWKGEQTKVMEQVVGYLKRTSKMALTLKPADPSKPVVLELHTDASWHTPRSQSGVVLVAVQYSNLEERSGAQVLALLDWNSNRQGLTADSSAAAEIISAHFGVRSSLPLAHSLREIWNLVKRKVAVRIDNQAVVEVSKKGSTKGLAWLATKPLSLRAGCMHDLTSLGVMEVVFIGTNDQLADLNTKALARVKLIAITDKLNLVEPETESENHKCKVQNPPSFNAAIQSEIAALELFNY